MKGEENNKSKITVQDWLNFLKSEKDRFAIIESSTTTRLIASGTLFIVSLVTISSPQLTYRWLGVPGIIISVVAILTLLNAYRLSTLLIDTFTILEVRILSRKLSDAEEISKELVNLTEKMGSKHNKKLKILQ